MLFQRQSPVRNIIWTWVWFSMFMETGVFWNVACTNRRGHVHSQAGTPTALQLRNSAVILDVTSLNFKHVIYIFQWRICGWAFFNGFCYGNVTAATEEYQSQFPWWIIPDCVFSNVQQQMRKSGLFSSVIDCWTSSLTECVWGKHYWNGTAESMS
jgi:hypothetical protein